MQNRLCNEKCCFQKQTCIPLSTIAEIAALQTDYWGEVGNLPPKNNERKEKNRKLFENAKYNADADEFFFDISTPRGPSRWVCENAFLKLCGISTCNIKSEAPDVWKVIYQF
jgi:hypothetical protein